MAAKTISCGDNTCVVTGIFFFLLYTVGIPASNPHPSPHPHRSPLTSHPHPHPSPSPNPNQVGIPVYVWYSLRQFASPEAKVRLGKSPMLARYKSRMGFICGKFEADF
eukprot:scaffold86044_cov33-Phaeocystis_antarctica.AAC.1